MKKKKQKQKLFTMIMAGIMIVSLVAGLVFMAVAYLV